MDRDKFVEFSHAVERLAAVPAFFADPPLDIPESARDFFARSTQEMAERHDALVESELGTINHWLLRELDKAGHQRPFRAGIYYDSWHHAAIEHYKIFAEHVAYQLQWSSKLAVMVRPTTKTPPYGFADNGTAKKQKPQHPDCYHVTDEQWEFARDIALQLPADLDQEIRTGVRRERAILMPDRGFQSPPQETLHGDDFRAVVWFGQQYTFTANQAACVKVLWEHWEKGTPDVAAETLLAAIDHEAPPRRLQDVFREHSAWGTLIIAGGTRGTHRLNDPRK